MPSLDNANPIVHAPTTNSSSSSSRRAGSDKKPLTVQSLWAEEGLELVDKDFTNNGSVSSVDGEDTEDGEEEEIDAEEIYGQ